MTETTSTPIAHEDQHGQDPVSPEVLKSQILDILSEEDDVVFEDRVHEFVSKRADLLEEQVEQREVSGFTKPIRGFIGSETIIKPVVVGAGFKLDDPEIYTKLFDTLREMYGKKDWREIATGDRYRQFLLHGIQTSLARYFGPKAAGAFASREASIWRGTTLDEEELDEPFSIADFKGRAFCAERSAVTQNLQAVLGFDTVMVIGNQKIGDKPEQYHAWNIVTNSRGEPVLYDPTQPQLVKEGNGSRFMPMLVPGAGVLLDGEQLVASRKAFTRSESGALVVEDEVPVVYSPPFSTRVTLHDSSASL